MKRYTRPRSSAQPLKFTTPTATTQEADTVEAKQDRAEIESVEAKQAAAKESDRIGSVVDYGPHVVDQSPTQIFGMALINACNGDVRRIPKWRFKRWYFRDKIIIDYFSTKREYDEAQVEQRRKMAHQFGFKYGALGPGMSYKVDLPEQLGK